jgi:hypothetical protein
MEQIADAFNKCEHGLTQSSCGFCHPPDRNEPPGHRGHPDGTEVARAEMVRQRIIGILGKLAAAGVDRPLPFFVEMAQLVTVEDRRENWSSIYSAKGTVENILAGRAAKHWSMDAIDATCKTVEELLQ